MKKVLLAGLVLMSSSSVWADWQLDNRFSKVSFVSVKKQNIGEAHHFTQLRGRLTDSGQLTVEIPLASVETGIPIRNQRMEEMLFNTKMFPQAEISARVEPQHVKLAVGQSKIITVAVDVGLHGVNKLMDVQVMITKVTEQRLLVVSLKPLVVKPADFGLDKGLMKLQAVAGLPEITQSVPVSFVLSLEQSQ